MPDEGASIGSVYVDVAPRADSFWAKFVAQNRAEASKAGDELGKPIAASISDAIAKGIRDGLSKSGRADAARSGTEAGTAFGEAFKQRVEAALRGLPNAKIGLDSSQVNRDITELRTQLERLRSRDLTVRVDVTQAYVDVVTLREELAGLGRLRPTVRADADTAGAMAQLTALIAEIDRVDGRKARVDVDDSGVRSVGESARNSSSGVSALVAAGVALGPALVPGAAAGAAAIAGILPMAIGAVGGIGVLALAVSGVVGAVKAMGAADNQAAQSAVSLAGNQSQLAAAADGVRSAQASLANTTASAAESQRRASEAIANAVVSEADADRQLLTAQLAVTQARIDASRAAEDLQSRVAHNALDQRQSALDTIKAEQALAAARDNAARQPGSPIAAQGLDQAQLAYDQQKQRNEDLIRDGKRLADDKTKSDKQGIDGNALVVTALERVRAATEGVHKAEQATADARIAYTNQARQSAASIAQAQQGVITAQRSLQQATVSTGTAGGAAMLALQQSMANLSPEGQRFSQFLYGLKPTLLGIRQAAEGGLLPGLQTGIEAMLPTVPRITGYVRAFSTEVGKLASEAGKAFASPYWAGFADLMVSKAIPALDTGAHVAGNFALGISGLVKAALPIGQDFGGGLLRFSENFAAHALTIQNTQGYRTLLDYIRTEGPIVAHTIGEVVTAAVRLVEAIAPLGGVSLTIIRLLAETINGLPIPLLTTLIGTIGGVVLAMRAWGIAQDAWKSSQPFIKGLIDVFSSAVQNARLNMSLAEGQTGRFGLALQGLKGAGQGAGSAIGSLIGAGGGLGIAVGAAAIGIGLLTAKMAANKAETEQAISAYERFGDAVAKARAAGQDDNTAELIKNDKALQDLILHANQYGISGKTVVDALAGQRSAFIDVNAALAAHRAELVKTIQEHTTQGGKGQQVMDDTAQAASNEVRHLDELAGRFGTVAQDQARAKDAADLYNKAQSQVTTTVYQQTPVQKALGDALNTLADKTKTAADQAGALRAADEAVFGAARAAVRSQEDQAAAEDALAAAGKRNADQHIFGAATLDLHTEAGRTNRRTLEDRLLALGQEYLADVQAGVGVDAATKKHDTNRDALVNAATAAGFDKDEVGKLVTTFGTLPTDPKVVVTVSGVQAALTQLENLEIAQLALKQGLDPSEATRQYKKQRAQANNFLGQGGLAAGGPVFGPGGPTEDKIPVWLSNGEHVITAREVQAAGGHGAIEAIRKTILGGASPQARYPGDGSGGLAFAGGGAVQWPFPTTAAMTKIPSLAEVQRAILFGPDFNGQLSGGMEAAAAFVRAQVGKPYIWASAGPDGFDCSGLISAAWNAAHGRNPYSHTFSTMNEAPYFPLPGYGAFTAGWTNPGERGPGGDSVGHTAGRIGNMAFESVGGQGVRIGSSVTPLGSFAHVGHYDSGGPLPPGLTLAYNGTGGNEQVYTADDHARAQAALAGGGTTNWNVYGSDGMSVHELAKAVAAEMAWQTR